MEKNSIINHTPFPLRSVEKEFNMTKSYITGGGSVSEILNVFYPVGTIYETMNDSFNPNTAWGGTWEKLTDKFLVAKGSTYTGTGGAATHSHSGSGNVGATTLTASQIPAHTHGKKSLTGSLISVLCDDGATIAASGIISTSTPRVRSWSGSDGNAVRSITIDASHEHTSVGGGGSHTHSMGSTASSSNIPPYQAVNIWRRTA